MNALSLSCRTCTESRDRIDELEEEVRQLREVAFGQDLIPPLAWRLTPTEATLVRLLVRHPLVRWETFEAAMTAARWDWEAEPKILDVYVSKLRKKLGPFGVEIVTQWGRGWGLRPSAREQVRVACLGGEAIVGQVVITEVKPPLTAAIITFVGKHPQGVHSVQIIKAFNGRAGADAILCALARTGRLRRTDLGKRKGFVYFPAAAR